MKKQNKKNRNHVAFGMIVSGTGKTQVFRHKSNRRPKDHKRSWKSEQW